MKRILIAVVGSATAVATMAACGYNLKSSDDAQPAANGAPATSQTTSATDAQGNGNGSGRQAAAGTATNKKVLKVSTIPGFSPIVTSATGRTVYRFDNDSPKPPTSACNGDCTKTWQPVLAGDGVEVQGGGIDTALLGTLDRPEGKQVTLKGWPLYYYVDDLKLGQTQGQGVGGVWFAISPKGGKATQDGAGAAKPTTQGKAQDKDVQTLTVNTVDGFMSFVTNEKGRTVYRFDKDTPKPPTTTCFGPCAKNWEPVLAGKKGIKLVGGRIKASDIGTIDRPEGKQVTLKGWPLYYFQADKKLGEVSGYGTGNVWFPIGPDGKKALRCV